MSLKSDKLFNSYDETNTQTKGKFTALTAELNYLYVCMCVHPQVHT